MVFIKSKKKVFLLKNQGLNSIYIVKGSKYVGFISHSVMRVNMENKWWKEEEGTSQKTYKNHGHGQLWGLTVGAGAGVGWAEEGKEGKIGTTVIE